MSESEVVGKRVLFVDDNKTISAMVKIALEKKGIKVDICDNLIHGLFQALHGRYDAVILDNMFPERIKGEMAEEVLSKAGFRTLMFTGDPTIKPMKSPIVRKDQGMVGLFNELLKVMA